MGRRRRGRGRDIKARTWPLLSPLKLEDPSMGDDGDRVWSSPAAVAAKPMRTGRKSATQGRQVDPSTLHRPENGPSVPEGNHRRTAYEVAFRRGRDGLDGVVGSVGRGARKGRSAAEGPRKSSILLADSTVFVRIFKREGRARV